MATTPEVTLSNMSSILKNQYLGPIREQFYTSSVLLSRLERKGKESVQGKNFIIPVHYGRNVGIGARAELGSLPGPGAQKYTETLVPMAYLYGAISVTGQTIKATRNDAGAFIRAVESEMKGLMIDMQADMNRQLNGNGDGSLTTCGTTSNSTTVTVDSTKYIAPGMLIDILDADGATITNGAAVKVLTVPSDTTFTVGAAVTTTSANIVTRAGVRSGATCYELTGLGKVISDSGTFQTIDRSANAWWKSVIDTNASNRAVTKLMLQKMEDNLAKNGGNPSLVLTTYGVRRAYFDLLDDAVRFVNTKRLDGGFDALEFNGKLLVVDRDCQDNTMWYIDESTMALYEMAPLDWMQEDGTVLNKIQGKDAYEATLYLYSQLGCDSCNKNGKIAKITEG